ncbi:MAG: NAD(P)-dependent oxidoreductase [Acidobacteriota bacterium]
MKLVVFNTSKQERPQFESLRASRGWQVFLFEDRLTAEFDLPAEARDAEAIAVFVNNPVDSETMAKFSNLKVVATRSTGYDHIDVDECRKRGIAVYTVPDYGNITVAEYTLGLILALLRRVRPMVEQGIHALFSRENLRGNDLAGKTVGVIGTGKIGKEVARRLAAFSVRILAFDKYPDQAFASEIASMAYVDLETLYRSSNVLTFHVPLSEETHHLFNRRSLSLVGWKTFLINTSRGPVVETEAIIEGLREGRLAGVALDTFESEEVMMEEQFFVSDQLSQSAMRNALATYQLLRSDRVILSPHNAYNTEEALQRIIDTTIANLDAFLAQKNSPNRLV